MDCGTLRIGRWIYQEMGKYADFVVLDRNPLKVDPDEFREIIVRGGLITYSDIPEYDRVEPPGKAD